MDISGYPRLALSGNADAECSRGEFIGDIDGVERTWSYCGEIRLMSMVPTRERPISAERSWDALN
jgi:hypothetical protein